MDETRANMDELAIHFETHPAEGIDSSRQFTST